MRVHPRHRSWFGHQTEGKPTFDHVARVRTEAFRWFAPAYVLVLGLTLLILPASELPALLGITSLRGLLLCFSALLLLLLALRDLPARARLPLAVVAALPTLVIAFDYLRLGLAAPLALCGLLGLGIVYTGLAAEDATESRLDLVGLVLGAVMAVQGLEQLLRPNAALLPFGSAALPVAAAYVVFGGAVVVGPLLPRTPRWLILATHLVAGGLLFAFWAAWVIRLPIYSVLGVATLLRGAALCLLPWVSPRLVGFDYRSLHPRLAVSMLVAAIVPGLLIVTVVLPLLPAAGSAAGSSARQQMFATALVSIAVFAALGWVLGGWLLRSVTALRRWAEALGQGEHAALPPALRASELTALAQSLAGMSQALQERADELGATLTEVRERTRFAAALNEISAVTTAALDADTILRRVVRIAGERFGCESASVAIRDAEHECWRPTHGWNVLEDVMIVGNPCANVPYAEIAFHEQRPVAVDDCAAAGLGAGELGWGFASTLAVPLTIKGESIGCLFFSNAAAPHTFTAAEIEFAQQIGAVISTALENARLFQEQRDIAFTLQKHLLRPLPELEDVELAMVLRPASAPELVGGDFGDVFLAADGSLFALVGDVSGKGVSAAGFTETVRSAIRTLTYGGHDPGAILTGAGEVLLSLNNDEQWATVLLLRIEPWSGALSYASAGHPPAMRVGVECVRLPVSAGPPLGIIPARYRTSGATLAPGEALVLYTDGLTEAHQPGMPLFGEERLSGLLASMQDASCEEMAQSLQAAVEEYAVTLRDDLLILALRVKDTPRLSLPMDRRPQLPFA